MSICQTYQEVAKALRNKQSFRYQPARVAIHFNVGQTIKNPIFHEPEAPTLPVELPPLHYRLKFVTTARTQILYSHSYDWPLFIAVHTHDNLLAPMARRINGDNIGLDGYGRLPQHCLLTHIIVNEDNHPITSLKTTVRRQLNFALHHYLAPHAVSWRRGRLLVPPQPNTFEIIKTTHKLANGLAAYIRDVASLRSESQRLDAGVAMFCAQNELRETNAAIERQKTKLRRQFRKVHCSAIHRMGAMV